LRACAVFAISVYPVTFQKGCNTKPCIILFLPGFCKAKIIFVRILLRFINSRMVKSPDSKNNCLDRCKTCGRHDKAIVMRPYGFLLDCRKPEHPI
jgi:hypothetical protein